MLTARMTLLEHIQLTPCLQTQTRKAAGERFGHNNSGRIDLW
jgi:hypothetical protein